MEKRMDEEILNLMKEFEEDKKGKYGKVGSIEHKILKEIEKGKIVLGEEIIEFEEKSLLENKIKILVPKIFELMPDEIALIKYPSIRRPSIIFTNEDTTINLTFNHTQNLLDESKLEEFKDEMMAVIRKFHPDAKIFEDGVKYINEKNIAFFDFLAPTIDSNVYNFMFLIELDSRALMCSFNCLEEDMELWKIIARGIMNSLRLCQEENE